MDPALDDNLQLALLEDDHETIYRAILSRKTITDEEKVGLAETLRLWAMFNRMRKREKALWCQSLLRAAIHCQSRQTTDMLLGMGVTIQSNRGLTAWHLAADARWSGPDWCSVMAPYGFHDACTPNLDGQTPLSYSVVEGKKSMVTFLLTLSNAESLNLPDVDGLTALHYAAKHGRKSTVVCLMEAGARSLARPCLGGRTPFEYAVREWHEALIVYMIQVDPSLLDRPLSKGRTVLEINARKKVFCMTTLTACCDGSNIADPRYRRTIYFTMRLAYRLLLMC